MRVSESGTKANTPGIVFDVVGMDCGDCALSVERVVGKLPEVETAAVSFASGTLRVWPVPGDCEPEALERSIRGAVDRAGYSAVARDAADRVKVAQAKWWTHRTLLPGLAAALLWVAGFVIDLGSDAPIVVTSIFATAIAVGGFTIMRSGWVAIRAGRIDMNVLMSISVVGAAALGEWSEGALVVVLFSVGTALQAVTFDRTRAAIRALFDLTPDEACLVRDDVEIMVAANALNPGDVVRVRPGERLPADAEVIDGRSTVDQAAITGESLPVEREPGDTVFAGTINGAGTLLTRVTAAASESMLANIVHLVEEAQSSKAPSQQMVDRFAAVYTPAVVVSAAVLAVAGGALTGDWNTWVYRALVLLVIACPCALVISTPVSIVSAIGAASRSGVLVKGGAVLEDAARIRTVVFDKTGTLTLGRPKVANVIVRGDVSEKELIATAAAAEQDSEHPIARSIVARALHDEIVFERARFFAAVPGKGVRATFAEHHVVVGSDRLMRESGVCESAMEWVQDIAQQAAGEGQSALSVARIASDGSAELLGAITVADSPRPRVREALEALRRAGVERIVMLTGDRTEVAATVASRIGVDDFRANLLPTEKSDAVRELQRDYGRVAMVGDGINDAPALAVADVGIAMGVGGTDIALESADLALMRDDLSTLARVIGLSQRTVSIIQQNVALSLITKLIALLLGAFGFVNLWIAVLADVGTSIVVTLNGLRLARSRSGDDSVPEPGSTISDSEQRIPVDQAAD